MNEIVTKGRPMNAEDVYDRIHQPSWRRRTASLMGGVTIGLIAGGAIGLLMAFVPSLLVTAGVAESAAILTPLLVVKTVAAFATAGSMLGLAALTTIGGGASAVAAGIAEIENRTAAKHGVEPLIEVKQEPDHQPLFKWRAAIITVPLTAAFGTLLAFGGLAPEPVTMGFAGGSTAAIASSGIAFGLFGSLFAQPFASYTNKVSNFYLKVITGTLFDKAPQPEVEKVTVKSPACAADEPAPSIESPVISEPSVSSRRFAAETPRFSLNGIIEKTDEPSRDHQLTLR